MESVHVSALDVDVDGRSRLSVMESRLVEIKDAYSDVKNELLRLERTWKRTQEKRCKFPLKNIYSID